MTELRGPFPGAELGRRFCHNEVHQLPEAQAHPLCHALHANAQHDEIRTYCKRTSTVCANVLVSLPQNLFVAIHMLLM